MELSRTIYSRTQPSHRIDTARLGRLLPYSAHVVSPRDVRSGRIVRAALVWLEEMRGLRFRVAPFPQTWSVGRLRPCNYHHIGASIDRKFVTASHQTMGVAQPTSRLAAAARAVLAEPHARPTAAAVSRCMGALPTDAPRHAWHSYLFERGWLSPAYASADGACQLAGLAVLSAALTFPLTIARSWKTLLGHEDEPIGGWRLGVVGARAEAALPVHMWSELAMLTHARRLTIDFCGPSAAPPSVLPHREWTGPDGQRLELRLPAKPDLFHRSRVGRELLEHARAGAVAPSSAAEDPPPPHALPPLPDDRPHAYILFNPGLGEHGWERAWSPTLRALCAARTPLLLSALSRDDAARDAAFFASARPSASVIASVAPEHQDNPFASLIAASGDGIGEGSGVARANSCCAVVLPRE